MNDFRNRTSIDKAISSIEYGLSKPKTAVEALEYQQQQCEAKPASCFNFRETKEARDDRYTYLKEHAEIPKK